MTWTVPAATRTREPNTAGERATLAAEQDRCRQVAAGIPLDATFEHELWGPLSVRWVYNHMIAEYARHLGHADLLRESIDGVTGE